MTESQGIALIFVPSGVDPDRVFAGRSLIDRSVAIAATLGLEPYFVGRTPRDDTDRGARAPLRWLEPGVRVPEGTAEQQEVVALWRCDVVWIAAVLRDLLGNVAGARVAALDDLGRPALAVLAPVWRPSVVPTGVASASAACAIVGRPGHLEGRRLIALDLPGTVDGAASSLRSTAPAARSIHAGSTERAAALQLPPAVRGTPAERAAAELVVTLDNPRDGIFDRLFNRHVSRRITPWVLPLPVTPNQVTVLSLLVGVLAAGALALPGILWPIAGALLLQLTAVLDCVDGEIARAKVLESEWGELLDITSDSVIHVLVFLGMAAHAWPDLGTASAWTLGGAFAVGGFASFAVVTRAERTEERWKSLDGWQPALLAKMLATLTTRDLSVLVLVAAATGTMNQLLVGAAFGAHGFWVTALLLHRHVMRRAESAQRESRATREPSLDQPVLERPKAQRAG
jgi:phosphatidylglycerophosphate synthase